MSLKKEPHDLLLELIEQSGAPREFAKLIDIDRTIVSHWTSGLRQISVRGVISICRCFPEIMPYALNAHFFPDDLRFHFVKEEK